jgi:integrase
MKSQTEAAKPDEGQLQFRKVAECLYRHEPSGNYYGLVKRRGKQIRRSLKTKDRQLATRRLVLFREKVARLSDLGARTQITFDELANRWFETIRLRLKPASAARRLTSIRQLTPFFGKMPVRNIGPRDCDEWTVWRGNEISASTFNNERETLRAVLNLAKRDGILLDNPAEVVTRRKLGKANLVIPTRQQFRTLLDTIRAMDRRAWAGADLVELLACSGMRLAEATALRWADVDFTGERFTVTGGEIGTKNSEARTVPLFPGLRHLLERFRKCNPPESRDARIIQITTAKKAIVSACRAAGLPRFNHHSLRHYFVSNAIEAGVDFKTIAAWIGHKDGGVLVAKTYGHLRDSHSAEMAKRMTFDTPRPNT